MEFDNKVAFIGGWIFTTVSSLTLMGLFRAAMVGLVGGFFGLLGKELYYLIKDQVKEILGKNDGPKNKR